MTPRILVLLAAGTIALNAGCRTCKRDTPRPYYGGPPPSSRNIPPTNIPIGPPPINSPPPSGSPGAPGVPGGGNAELLLPQGPPTSKYPQYENEPVVPEPRALPKSTQKSEGANPPLPEMANANPPAKPVPVTGIREFSTIKDGVAAGQRPEIEGLDWLKSKGYQTVVYIHGPNEDDTTDRRQAERRELKFISLPLTPETLDEKWLEEFNRLVGDTGSRPVFIYDRDGTLAGPIWYLHFRTAEFLTHDEAKVRASRLGLKEGTAMTDAAMKHIGVRP